IRGSASKNAHNPDVAEAFMNKDKEVKIGDRVVHPKGAVLTLNSQEATERINGKPLLAEGVVDSIADLTKKAGLTGNVVAIEPTGFEQIAFWITALAPLLLLGGILGPYLEFKIPGATWPELFPDRLNALRAAAQHVHRHCGLVHRDRPACALSAAYEHLPAVRLDRFKSAGSIACWHAATIRDCTGAHTRNARHGGHGFATERQSAFCRSRCRCCHRGRIHRSANAGQGYPNRRNARRGQERSAALTLVAAKSQHDSAQMSEMADQWIIRVLGKEYGPADIETLREWKTEGRLLPENEARRVDVDPAP